MSKAQFYAYLSIKDALIIDHWLKVLWLIVICNVSNDWGK